MSALALGERPAAGEANGLLVLHHGRGADEHDLLALGGVLDPQGLLHVVTPRAPLKLPGSPGNHWYVVPRVGYPDHDTFHSAYAELAEFHDELWRRTGISPERTVLGGFSMGSVMSYALGLGADRPAPAGIMALSGFIPVGGILIKSAIAYAGTVVVGEGATFYELHGRHMASVDAAKVYEDARTAAQTFARDMLARIRGNGSN